MTEIKANPFLSNCFDDSDSVGVDTEYISYITALLAAELTDAGFLACRVGIQLYSGNTAFDDVLAMNFYRPGQDYSKPVFVDFYTPVLIGVDADFPRRTVCADIIKNNGYNRILTASFRETWRIITRIGELLRVSEISLCYGGAVENSADAQKAG